MKRPLFVLALAWMCGILLSGLVPFGLAIPIVGAGFVLLAVEFYRRPIQRDRRWVLTFLCFAMVFVGYFRAALVAWDYERKLERAGPLLLVGYTELEGRLVSAFDRTEKGWKALLRTPKVRVSGKVRSLPARAEIWVRGETKPAGEAGDQVRARGRWRRALPAPLAGEFDPGAWNRSRDVVGSFQVWSDAEYGILKNLSPNPYERLIRFRDRWRARVNDWFLTNLPGQEGALVLAMTTGQRRDLSEEVRSDLIRSGLFHLTAVSGLHVTAMLIAFPWIFKLLGIRRGLRGLLGIPLALLLLLLVGGRPSVVRATVLGMALMVGVFLDRRAQTLNLLGAAALLLLAYDPTQLASPAFQLSFFIVSALSLWGWKGEEGSLGRRFDAILIDKVAPTHPLGWMTGRSIHWLASAFWTSAVAVLAAAPLTAYHFHQVSYGGLIGNLLGIPLAIVTTLIGMSTLLFVPLFPNAAEALANPLGCVAGVLLNWAGWVAQLPHASFPVTRPTPFGLCLLVVTLMAFTSRISSGGTSRRRWRGAALALLAIFVWWPAFGIGRDLRVAFLNVGQGDSCLLQFPTGETLLIDAGPPRWSRTGRPSVLASALLERGVRRLDAVVVSHPEEDHFGGLSQLVQEIPVGAILCSGDTNPSGEFLRMADAVRSASVDLVRVLDGDRIVGFGGSIVTVLNPTADEIVHQTGSRNERSLVLLFECDGLRALFPGDVGEETETELIPRLQGGGVHLLKVGHHGSRYSSSTPFLKRARPSLAVVCCGENTFGHPHEATIDRLLEAGAEVYSTYLHGTVEFSWDGTTLRKRFPN